MQQRLPRPVLLGYAAGSVGTGGFSTLPGLVLAYYLTDTLAVPALLATVVVVVPKAWDVLIDPLVGAHSDREAAGPAGRTRLMLWGAVTLPLGFVGMFAVPPGLGPVGAGVWVLACFVLATTSFSCFQVPYIALPADLTDDYGERTRVMAWRIATLALAILLVGAGGPALRDAAGGGHGGYLVMALGIAVLLLAGMLATVLGTRRHLSATQAGPSTSALEGYRSGLTAWREERAYRTLLSVFVLQALATGVMLAAAQYVATYTLGDQTALTLLFAALVAPALLVMPLWTRYAARRGKAGALRAASLVFAAAALGLVVLLWAPGWWVYPVVGVAGVAYAGMQLFPLAMLPDVISAAGRERGGAMSGLWTAGETTGLALGPVLVLVLLGLTGFRSSTAGEQLAQPGSATAAIALAFSLVPAVLVGLSLLVLRRYPEPASLAPATATTTTEGLP
ncbi:Sugar transporter [Serinicoccus hydrothermalis]|uniref:Sugar transporter n=1 Tax=Serinicoccus hydrothermalis TaxID=1758689 RepID=A0A1B1NG05_9MICO|nr:MFS transporter [Serinicoccus hydrothermalis]ANS80368.1 Sugar transporter [Serinicoccus hydrothermalis]